MLRKSGLWYSQATAQPLALQVRHRIASLTGVAHASQSPRYSYSAHMWDNKLGFDRSLLDILLSNAVTLPACLFVDAAAPVMGDFQVGPISAKVREMSPPYLLSLSFTLLSTGQWNVLHRLKQLDEFGSMLQQIGQSVGYEGPEPIGVITALAFTICLGLVRHRQRNRAGYGLRSDRCGADVVLQRGSFPKIAAVCWVAFWGEVPGELGVGHSASYWDFRSTCNIQEIKEQGAGKWQI